MKKVLLSAFAFLYYLFLLHKVRSDSQQRIHHNITRKALRRRNGDDMTEKGKTLWATYYELNSRMAAHTITDEKRAELRPLSTKIKHAAELASLSPAAQEAVERIKTLRSHTLASGFRTTRSQNEILEQFTGAELADILRAVNNG